MKIFNIYPKQSQTYLKVTFDGFPSIDVAPLPKRAQAADSLAWPPLSWPGEFHPGTNHCWVVTRQTHHHPKAANEHV